MWTVIIFLIWNVDSYYFLIWNVDSYYFFNMKCDRRTWTPLFYTRQWALSKKRWVFGKHSRASWLRAWSGNFLLIYICNFHVLSNFLLIYICKLHWNLRYIGISNTYDLDTLQGLYDAATIKVSAIMLEQPVAPTTLPKTCHNLTRIRS
jgi:hypothetical protein